MKEKKMAGHNLVVLPPLINNTLNYNIFTIYIFKSQFGFTKFFSWLFKLDYKKVRKKCEHFGKHFVLKLVIFLLILIVFTNEDTL